jgi:hypothetical protein
LGGATVYAAILGSISYQPPMIAKLLDIFLAEDGDVYVRHKLLDAICNYRTGGMSVVRKYTFNRFNVTLDFEKNEVTVEDDLMLDQKSECKLSVEEFEKALLEHQ